MKLFSFFLSFFLSFFFESIFLGVWQRTNYISGSWPQCLSGVHTARVGISSYDAPEGGVVWRFVSQENESRLVPSKSTTKSAAASSSTSSLSPATFIRGVYIELVDHSMFSTGEQRLYLASDLSLVSSTIDAAAFIIEQVNSFRNGPNDVALRIMLADGRGGRMILCSIGVDEESSSGSGGGGGGEKSEESVVLVSEDRLNTRRTDGELLYNIAWEATSDTDTSLVLVGGVGVGVGVDGESSHNVEATLEKYDEKWDYRMN